MPCYLFTYHAYGTWLPDRKGGYVKRDKGVLPTDAHMYRLYTEAMKDSVVDFLDSHQRQAIQTLLESAPLQKFELYFVATNSTHVHVLLAWHNDRKPVPMRGFVKGSITRAFNAVFQQRTWIVEGGSRKQVRDRKHFDYLVRVYLPKHTGLKWSREKGLHK